jgi:hypothetical protein
MFLDRSESRTNAVADAVRDRTSVSLVEAVVQVLSAGIQPGLRGDLVEARQMQVFRLFGNPSASPSTTWPHFSSGDARRHASSSSWAGSIASRPRQAGSNHGLWAVGKAIHFMATQAPHFGYLAATVGWPRRGSWRSIGALSPTLWLHRHRVHRLEGCVTLAVVSPHPPGGPTGKLRSIWRRIRYRTSHSAPLIIHSWSLPRRDQPCVQCYRR